MIETATTAQKGPLPGEKVDLSPKVGCDDGSR
jgi:hypothetical protein